ncbi:putative RNA methyltransferase [Streptomyces sp. 184]|uniref:putative RNA methyltransferase n=1 Tax=Streptomyces sp. 184 TaxID=1827526 RepID=UPI0038920705
MSVPLPAALAHSLDVLRCPTCRRTRRLHPDRRALRCPAGHTFDIARQGYVSLLTGAGATSGDDAAMVRARSRFLSTGAYAPLREIAAGLAADGVSGSSGTAGTAGASVGSGAAPGASGGSGSSARPVTVVDAGCGTGYYLAGVLDRLAGARGVGLDTSVRALRAAARAHDRAAAVAGDVFRPLPLAGGTADIVLNVFAPRNPAEFHRVLHPAGRLIVVRPTGRHLAELRDRWPGMVTVDPAKEERLRRALGPFFEAAATERAEYSATLTGPEAADLVAMTPSARHVGRTDDDARLPGRVTVSVLATAYRPRPGRTAP